MFTSFYAILTSLYDNGYDSQYTPPPPFAHDYVTYDGDFIDYDSDRIFYDE